MQQPYETIFQSASDSVKHSMFSDSQSLRVIFLRLCGELYNFCIIIIIIIIIIFTKENTSVIRSKFI